MKTRQVEVKRQLLEEALDQLKRAQQDCYVLATASIINELEAVLRQPDVSGRLLTYDELLEQADAMGYKLTNYTDGYDW
jgi:hypothetical protein